MADEENNSGVIGASMWMLLVSVLLIWLPVFGSLIAGFVGGKKAGGIGKGLIASLLPGIILGGLTFFAASSLTGIPVIGAIAGLGGLILALLNTGPLMIGAIIGGILA